MISGHTLVLGISKGGKTTLSVEIINWYRKSGYKIILLATFKNDIPCDEHYAHEDEFIARARQLRNCLLVVDDARDNLDKHSENAKWLGSQSRHWGHSFLVITQRYVDIAPSVRNNAESAVIFRMSKKDCLEVSEDYVDDALKDAYKLEKYHFLIGGKYQAFSEKCLKI